MIERVRRQILVAQEEPVLMGLLVAQDHVVNNSPQEDGLIQNIMLVLGKFANLDLKRSEMITHEQRLPQKMREVMCPVEAADAAGEGRRVPNQHNHVHIKTPRQP